MKLSFNQPHVKRLMSIKNQLIAVAIAALMAATTSYADEDHRANERGYHASEQHEYIRDHHVFALRDSHRFSHEELEIWRRGRWNQTCYLGRCGWWWFTGEQWYFYDRPVYPYPPVVSDVTYLEPVTVAPQLPSMAPPSPLPAQSWYYCESARNYYPYVPSCPEGWKLVPAQPPEPR